jgi:hypothetical protein
MFASLQQHLSLWLRERIGFTANFLILVCIVVVAILVAFIFLCVSAYAWAATELGPVFGGLATAGVFLAIAAGALAAATFSRARARQRTTLERAARTRRIPPLMDPKMLRMAMAAGSNIGWQRLISIALVGFLATQPAKERRYEHAPDETI